MIHGDVLMCYTLALLFIAKLILDSCPICIIVTICLSLAIISCQKQQKINHVYHFSRQFNHAALIIPVTSLQVLNSSLPVYGSDVELRRSYFSSSPPRPYIYTLPLPAGVLTKYYFFQHNVTVENVTAEVALQIWRPTEVENHYLLVWQKLISVQLESVYGNQGALYEV